MTEFRPGRFEILPIVIKNLLIINGLFFLAQITIDKSGLINMNDLFALHHVKSPLFRPWQLVTHLFLHGDFFHIFFNMLGLWTLGSVLENVWGPKRFITFYFLCGIGSGVIQLVSLWYQYHDVINLYVSIRDHASVAAVQNFYNQNHLDRFSGVPAVFDSYFSNPGSVPVKTEVIKIIADYTNIIISTPTIGASGAVFGVLAAFIYLFPNAIIILYFLPLKAKWIGLLYFGGEVYSAFINSPTDNIAHWAHLGGGLVGFLLVLTWNKKNPGRLY